MVLGSASSQRMGDRWAGTAVVARDAILADDPHATRRPSRGTSRAVGIALGAALLFTVAFNYFGRPPLVIEGMYNQHQLLETLKIPRRGTLQSEKRVRQDLLRLGHPGMVRYGVEREPGAVVVL